MNTIFLALVLLSADPQQDKNAMLAENAAKTKAMREAVSQQREEAVKRYKAMLSYQQSLRRYQQSMSYHYGGCHPRRYVRYVR